MSSGPPSAGTPEPGSTRAYEASGISVGAPIYRHLMTPRGRPGPVYDDAMKLPADDDLDAVLAVVGVEGHGAEPPSTELPGSRVRRARGRSCACRSWIRRAC